MNEQLKLFIVAFSIGICGGLVYGLISIFRHYISHNIIGIYIEDILYWVIFSISAFLVMLYFNYGEIRPYIIIGIFLGLIVYGAFIHRLTIFLLSPIIKILRLAVEIILTPFSIILFPFKKLYIVFKKHLKNNVNCEKISLLRIRSLFKKR